MIHNQIYFTSDPLTDRISLKRRYRAMVVAVRNGGAINNEYAPLTLRSGEVWSTRKGSFSLTSAPHRQEILLVHLGNIDSLARIRQEGRRFRKGS